MNKNPWEVVGLAATCLLPVLPFLFPIHPLLITSFYTEWLAFALGCIACLAFLSYRFWSELSLPRVALYCTALLAIVAIQGFAIPRPYLAQVLMPGIYLVWAALLMVLASWLRKIFGLERVLTLFAYSLLGGALLQAFSGLIQYLGIGGWLGAFVAIKLGPAVYGNIVQPNHFATHITLAVVAISYLSSQRRLSMGLTLPLLAFFAFIVTLSGSRAVLLYAFALSVLSVATYIKRRDNEHFRFCLTSVFFLSVFLSFQHLIEFINPWLAVQLTDLSLNSYPFSLATALEKMPAAPLGIELRTTEWHKAWLMFLEAPLFGVGIGNYGWYSFQYQSLPEFAMTPKPQLFAHSHNLFAQVLAETGIAGVLILATLLVTWIIQFKDKWLLPSGWFIAGTLIVLFIHSNLEYPLWYSFFLGIAAFLLALGDNRLVKIKFTPWLGQFCTSIALFIIASILVFNLLSFRTLANVTDNFFRSDQQQQINIVLGMTNNPLLAPYSELVLAALMPADKDQIEEKLAVTTRQFRRNPDPYKVYKQVTFLALANRMDEANALLEQAARAYPEHLPLYVKQLEKIPTKEIQQLLGKVQKLTHSSLPV